MGVLVFCVSGGYTYIHRYNAWALPHRISRVVDIGSFPNLFLANPLDHFTRRATHFGCQGPLHGSDLGRDLRTDGDWVTPMCHDFGLLPGLYLRRYRALRAAVQHGARADEAEQQSRPTAMIGHLYFTISSNSSSFSRVSRCFPMLQATGTKVAPGRREI